MAVARGNGQNGGHFYSNLTFPVEIDLNFVVDSTNGNGLGIRSLKSNGYVQSVFMHSVPAATTTPSVFPLGTTVLTVANLLNIVVGEVVTDTTTPTNITAGTTVLSINRTTNQITISAPTVAASAVSPGDTLSFAMVPALVGNPNPAVGFLEVIFKNNFNVYIGGFSGFVSPLSGTPIGIAGTSLVIGQAYVIVSVGTSTLADWQAVGLPIGFVPTVGQSFIAIKTGNGAGTGAVEVPLVAGVDSMQIIGDPNQMIANSSIASNNGAYVLLQFLEAGALATPTNNTVVGMTFKFDRSSVTIDGL
jgi:hypothetical protein